MSSAAVVIGALRVNKVKKDSIIYRKFMFDFILQLGIMDIKLEEGEAGSIIHLVSRISAALPGPNCSKHCRHNKVSQL